MTKSMTDAMMDIIERMPIRYVRTVKPGETDHPVFSKEQVERMTVIPDMKRYADLPTEIPYMEDREYVVIEGFGIVLRWKDTIAIIEEKDRLVLRKVPSDGRVA